MKYKKMKYKKMKYKKVYYTMKKRVAILFSGQTRSNSLNANYNKDTLILDSISQNFLNAEFKSKYDYDVFMSIDQIDFENAAHFFGTNLKNIHITETDTYLHPIEIAIPKYDFFYEKMTQLDYKGCTSYIQNTYQYYRFFCAYNMMRIYQNQTDTNYDYIVRIRPDSRLMQNLIGLFNILDKTDIKFITEHEQLCIFKYELRDICKLIDHFGTYNKSMHEKYSVYRFYSRNKAEVFDDVQLRFSPEKQFMDHVYYTILDKGHEFNDVFLGITYPSFNLLYREDGSYGYENYTSEWKPYTCIEDLYKNFIHKLA
jgi:hypothetical protein